MISTAWSCFATAHLSLGTVADVVPSQLTLPAEADRPSWILAHNDEPTTPPKPPARRDSHSKVSGNMRDALQDGVPAVSELGETLGLQGRVEGPRVLGPNLTVSGEIPLVPVQEQIS